MRSFEKNSITDIENLITKYPILAHAIYHNSKLTTLHFAVNIPTIKGLSCFKLLLEKGAVLNLEIINQIKQSSSNPFKNELLKTAYKYATTIELKMKINPEKTQIDQQTPESTLITQTSETSDQHNKPVIVKESGCSCIISIVKKIIYDNELLNHPKIQKMLEVASKKSMTSELIELGKDKDITGAITSAIAETKNKMFAEAFPNGIEDKQILAEINSQLEDISIQKVLDILLTQALKADPEVAVVTQNSALAEIHEFIKTAMEALIDTAKMLEILNFIMQTSGHQFIGGFHSSNPDDDLGGNTGGGASLVFDNYPLDNAEKTTYALPGNYTNFDAILVN